MNLQMTISHAVAGNEMQEGRGRSVGNLTNRLSCAKAVKEAARKALARAQPDVPTLRMAPISGNITRRVHRDAQRSTWLAARAVRR